MKIALASDLHLEFGTISLENAEGADVLVLSGDICVAKDLFERDTFQLRGGHDKSNKYHTFFQECSANFSHVIYIVGNHEHYHGDYAHTVANLRGRLSYLDNLHILDKEFVHINDVTFVGGTLWTDMNKEDPNTLNAIRGMMNDFRCVENSNREVTFKAFDITPEGRQIPTFRTRPATFCPEDAVEDHKALMEFIKSVVEADNDNGKFVIVGHHAPSKLSTKPCYKDDVLLSGGYSSDLSEFILDHPQIKLWAHGHTHDEFDYMIGETRIVCNPRGYDGYEDRADKFKLKYIEV